MSTPIVENGQLQEFCVVGLKSGSKDMSNGRRFGSDGHKLVRSVCRCVFGDMYPARDSAGCSANAQLSRRKLCGAILLCLWHVNMWSPHTSWMHPQGHVGMLVSSKSGRRSFRFIAIRKLQLGNRFRSMLRHMETSGYDVCGTSMLGRSLRWSLDW